MVEVLERCGGVADARTLVAFTSRRKVAAAMQDGHIVRGARGRYALPDADEACRAAHRLAGVVTGVSAAAAHGWETKFLPGPTVIDCARTLPFDEALAVADSALRHGAVTRSELARLAGNVATTGRARSMRVAREATHLAANPFESVLRAIALDVPGLDLRPQVVIRGRGFAGRPDLVDEEHRVVVEAESFEFHGQRRALRRDCERYTALTLLGWTVVRFAWEHVMFDPTYVADCLHELAAARGRAQEQVTLPDLPRFCA